MSGWQLVTQPLCPPGVVKVQSAMRPYTTNVGNSYGFLMTPPIAWKSRSTFLTLRPVDRPSRHGRLPRGKLLQVPCLRGLRFARPRRRP